MTLPKSILIAGVNVKIVQQDLSDDECFGYWSFDRKTIVLSDSLRGVKLAETLRHEMLHATFDLCGVGFIKDFPDEAVIRALEHTFFPNWKKVEKSLGKK